MLVQSASELRSMVEALSTHEVSIGGSTVDVIFEAAPGDAFGLADRSSPQITLLESDWPTVTRGSSVTVGGTAYVVIGIEPDSYGLTTLRLERS